MNLLITGAARFNDAQLNEIANLGHNVFFLQNEQGHNTYQVFVWKQFMHW